LLLLLFFLLVLVGFCHLIQNISLHACHKQGLQ
jgi:hypothetical protein